MTAATIPQPSACSAARWSASLSTRRRSRIAAHEPCVTGFVAALKQGDGGAYVNFLVDEGEARIRDAYPGKTWDRLRSIKRRYDPTNLFRLNQNIPPAI